MASRRGEDARRSAATTARAALRGGAVACVAAAAALTLASCDGDDSGPDPTASATASAPAHEVPVVEGEHVDNAYEGATMYVDDTWAALVNETADATEDAELANAMRVVSREPTGVWMDRISAIEGNADGPGLRHHLDAAVEQAESGDAPVVLTVVVYNLPGRDCYALASNGELPATDEGLDTYEHDYIDVIASMLAEEEYRNLRIVTLIEPDSLPNLVTNASEQACQDADPYYREGVAYALDAFARLDHVYAYLDAAHAGWLGWDSNAGPAAQLFADVVTSTDAGYDAIDGFITNTANYTPLDEPYLTDPEQQVGGQPVKAASFYEYNANFDEADWTADLYARLVAAGFPDSIGMLIDTSRNGWGGPSRPLAEASSAVLDSFVEASKVDRRGHRGAWCNQAGAGLGRLPQALPAGFPDSHLDALIWAKPPGQSDGSSSEVANDEGKGFDRMCDPSYTTDRLGGRPTNAMGNAPVSGQWFAAQFTQLVENANPAIGAARPLPRDPDDDEQSASATPTAEATAGSAGACTADMVLRDVWSTGFVADVTVTATAPLEGWEVSVALPEGTTIVNQWTAEFSATSGTLTVGDVGWNGTLEAGATATFGFTGQGDAPAAGALACVSP
ncbi:glycoside hydrolase family 6 protein [Demequina sp. NBRC 110057]|uniref:glycoside hydrolase family 6 protein n=1 Tax=Demequina sp. NBRC 110057 TaxID=1570346 RepID=UPI000A01E76B|nr:glycoside hydrolase family 6 protein [Demequina sp. NBRC 110057]